MSWNPNASIALFEPGCIQCTYCGFKPEDPWDTSPEGFNYCPENGWMCQDCCEKEMLEAGIPLSVIQGESKLSQHFGPEQRGGAEMPVTRMRKIGDFIMKPGVCAVCGFKVKEHHVLCNGCRLAWLSKFGPKAKAGV